MTADVGLDKQGNDEGLNLKTFCAPCTKTESSQDFMVQRSQIKCGKSFILYFVLFSWIYTLQEVFYSSVCGLLFGATLFHSFFSSYSVKIITFCRYCKVHGHI